MATTTEKQESVPGPAELIQLMRTCNLNQVSTQLVKDYGEQNSQYDAIVKFYQQASKRKP